MLDVFARVRLLFDKDKDFRAELAGILGFLPFNIDLYKTAFSHSSQPHRSPKGGRKVNNERLEFLGDAILEAVVSDLVYHHFENKREGFLTDTRSKLVQRSTLNDLASDMGLDRLIRTGARGQSHNSNIGGNAFEALIGAIYLDRGYRTCKKFVEKRILRKFVDIDDVAHKEVNFKSKILEYCQKNRIVSEFKLKNIDKTEVNSPVFRSILSIEGVMVGEGKGYSKKESEQQACRDALLRMRRSSSLVAQIFEAKEAQTCTEAPVFAAVPKIDEIEEEIARMGEAKIERRRQQRNRQKERKEEQTQQLENASGNNQAKPFRQPKAQEQKPDTPQPITENKADDKEKGKAKAQNTGKKAQKTEEPEVQQPQEKAEDSRNSRRRKGKPADKPAANVKGEEAPVEASASDLTPTQPEAKEVWVRPIALRPKKQEKAEEEIPAPLFLISDIKDRMAKQEEQPAPEKKTRRPRRKPQPSKAKGAAAKAEATEAPKAEEEFPQAEETIAPAEEKDAKPAKKAKSEAKQPTEKKPRRTRRRKPTAEAEGNAADATNPSTKGNETGKARPALDDAPTLPFAP